jgi:Phosphodiester glycosidase
MATSAKTAKVDAKLDNAALLKKLEAHRGDQLYLAEVMHELQKQQRTLETAAIVDVAKGAYQRRYVVAPQLYEATPTVTEIGLAIARAASDPNQFLVGMTLTEMAADRHALEEARQGAKSDRLESQFNSMVNQTRLAGLLTGADIKASSRDNRRAKDTRNGMGAAAFGGTAEQSDAMEAAEAVTLSAFNGPGEQTWASPEPGVKVVTIQVAAHPDKNPELSYPKQRIHAAIVDMATYDVKTSDPGKIGQERAVTVDKFAKATGSVVAINGAYAKQSAPKSEAYGLNMSEGKQWGTNLKGRSTMMFDANDKARVATDSSTANTEGVTNAIGGDLQTPINDEGQLLGGPARYKGANRFARSALGQRQDGSLVFMVAEGINDQSGGMTFMEASMIMKDFGCIKAVMLGGGGESSLIVAGVRLNNRKKNEESVNRTVNSHVGVVRSPAQSEQ